MWGYSLFISTTLFLSEEESLREFLNAENIKCICWPIGFSFSPSEAANVVTLGDCLPWFTACVGVQSVHTGQKYMETLGQCLIGNE